MPSHRFQNPEVGAPAAGRFDAPETSAEDPISKFPAGGINAVANLLGMPVDAVAWAMNKGLGAAGLDQIKEPFMGSEFIKKGYKDVGILPKPGEFEQFTPGEKMAFRAGETALGATPIAAGPAMALGLGAKAKGVMGPILKAAQKDPTKFIGAEAAAVSGATQGTLIAESIAPDSPFLRFTAEMLGGALNPMGLTARAVTGATRQGTEALKSFTPAGKRANASRAISEMLADAGEDVVGIEKALRTAPQGDVLLTSGQQTGSPTLLAMETQLAKESYKFYNVAKERSTAALSSLRGRIDAMAATGDPESLRMAAVARQGYYDDIITQRVNVATREAAEKAARVGVAGSSQANSLAVYNTMENALKDVRAVESDLWSRIPSKTSLSTDSLRSASIQAEAMLLKGETIPFVQEVRDVLRLTRNPATGQMEPSATNVGKALKLRSRLMARARELRAQSEWSQARQHTLMANGIMDDLNLIATPDADAARQFSLALNEKFSRTFAGDALAETGAGGQRIMPETLLERAFAGGGIRGERQFAALEEAAGFSAPAMGAAVRSEQEQFLRIVAQRTMREGKVDPERLRAFVANNPDMMARFPEMQADFSDAAKATEMLTRTLASTKMSQQMAQKTAFAKVAGVQDPVRAIGEILNGPFPQKMLTQLARMAKKSGPGAVAGLKTSVLDYVMIATKTNGIDFNAISNALRQPISRHQASLIGVMRRNNIFTAADVTNINTMLDQAMGIETALRSGQRIAAMGGDTTGLFDLIVRMTGAQAAGLSPLASTTGSGIVVAGAGSRFARNLFEKVPNTKLHEVLIEASLNPDFLADLIQVVPPPRRTALDTKIGGYLAEKMGIMEPLLEALKIAPKGAESARLRAYALQAGIPSEEE